MSSFVFPNVSDGDVAWAAQCLGLAPHAFSGADGTDPRKDILKSAEAIDVESCPGSGKTTLVVAKLAILARDWKNTAQGICVLSHTNAARHEVERLLGKEPRARALLSYPHFVGTIHSFANEFLALPALRSRGIKPVVMDDKLCEQHRRDLLRQHQFAQLRSFVTNKEKAGGNLVADWRLHGSDCKIAKRNGTAVVGPKTASAAQLATLGRVCAEDGYYCFSESFVWARDLMERYPDVIAMIRERFPIIFVDEAQDNDADQSSFLYDLFLAGRRPSICQRFGDSNQAIYNDDGSAMAKGSGAFPVAANTRVISNSYRFGQAIADLADPLGVTPCALQGLGPKPFIPAKMGQNAIFLFNEQTGSHVLKAYSRHLLANFTADERAMSDFVAVGYRHKPGANNNFPRSVGNFWEQYDWQATASDPRPSTFLQYASMAKARASAAGSASEGVTLLAAGLMQLGRYLNLTFHERPRARPHQFVEEKLRSSPQMRARYESLLLQFMPDANEISEATWLASVRAEIIAIATAISGATGAVTADAREFLQWTADVGAQPTIRKKSSNEFVYPANNPQVKVRVGSINAVKGQTHTATLVLETFFKRHQLQELLPWLLGVKSGGNGEGPESRRRLKTHYVAMTRPTHLLCLAMRDTIDDVDLETLRSRGWRIARVGEHEEEWLLEN